MAPSCRSPVLMILTLGGLWLGGCADSSSSTEKVPQVVFVCQESGEVFIGPARPTPAVHPHTGRATIMPGLYSPQKKAWIAAPPLETQQRAAANSNQPEASRLQREGPIPETAIPF